MTLRFRSWGALLLGVLHIVLVVVPLVASGGHGESQAFLVALADFPLVWLLDHVPGGSYILYKSTAAYVAFFAIFGTLMYAAVGAALGVLLNRAVHAMRSGEHRT